MNKLLYILPFLALAAVSCDKGLEKNKAVFTAEQKAQVAFRVNSPATRASEVTTATLTQFNVIATTGTTTQTLVWDDGVFTGTSGNDYTGGKYWPSENVTWNFFASNAPMTFAATGATIAVADCDLDIIADYLEGATYKQSNALGFDHILCQLGTVTMKAPDTFTVTNLKVSLLPITSGTYAVKSIAGTEESAKRAGWTRGEAATEPVYVIGSAAAGVDIPAATNTYTSADNDLWLVPGQYQLTATYTITKGDYTANFTALANVTLHQGNNNNLGLNNGASNIPAPGDIQEIIFTVEVTPWENLDVPVEFVQS